MHLPQVNINQRKLIIFFLYDNEFIRADPYSTPIDLKGADVSNLQFNYATCDLVNIFLTNVVADSIQFENCHLEYADFSGSRMVNAKFVNSRLGAAKFIETNLADALFQRSNHVGLRLANAVLVRSRFPKAPQNTIFINTDLLGSSWTEKEVTDYIFNQQSNFVVNTRFSDGTFSAVDSKQLVIDGGAEQGVKNSTDSSKLFNKFFENDVFLESSR